MTELLAEDLVRLKRETGGPRLSLFLPLAPQSAHSTRLRTRTKNALLRADQALRASGDLGAEGAQVLSRAHEALSEPRPRGRKHLGLALFADAERVRRYLVPLRLPALAAVGDRFTIAPLLAAITTPGCFYVLALGQEEIRLYRGTSLALQPLDGAGLELAAWRTMPRSRARQAHAVGAAPSGPGGRAIFNGVDRESDDRKARTLEHFRGTDRALRETLRPAGAPLVLAGAPHLQALYRSVNSYPHLLDAGIDGSPEQLGTEQLHRLAWAIAEPALAGGRHAAVERYLELRGSGRTVEGVDEVYRAAVESRVETVLVDERACAWPAESAEDTLLLLDATPSAGERLELAVVETLRGSGTAFVIPEREWPADGEAVAILRG
jgi:hypothetical protein